MKRYVQAVITLLIFAILATHPVPAEASADDSDIPEGLEVYFMDLGRVDAILIRADGETCLIDVGFKNDAKPAMRFMRALGIDHLDCYVGTHGHYDHIEGAPEIIEAFRPDVIYLSHLGCMSAILDCASDAQREIIDATERVVLTPGDGFTLGMAHLTCLGPLSITQCLTGSSTENENSLILRLEYGERSMLLTSDTTDKVLRDVNAASPGCLKADVLKNPHHNGAHDDDVIDMIKPQYIVFCTDDENIPKQTYQEALLARDIRPLLTGSANQGSVCICSDGEKLEVRCGYSVNSIEIEAPPPMYAGQELQLSASVVSASVKAPNRQLGWNSSDESVAIAHNGKVRAVAPGKAVITAAAINGVSASVAVTVYSALVELDENELRLAVGETRRLTGSIIPTEAEGVTGEWISTNPFAVTVEDGKITAIGEGRAQVVARLSNGAQAACDVTVKGVPAKSVKLNQSKATLSVGDTLQLTAKVSPEGYDEDSLAWTSSDESILWVDDYGSVTAVGKGRAKITVTASAGVTDTCTIKVK